MIKLSKSPQLAQQVINFRLTSDQYLLSSTLRHWHFLHGVNHAIKFVTALVDDTVTAFAEDPQFFEVLRVSTTEERWLGDIRT